ncbi:MAG: hypothetical protein HZA19_03265 [Nitrospirae bacterium]|nr:hypothetical protein [Nitrospirota bacterium]
MKTLGAVIIAVGIFLLGAGDTFYALNQLMDLSPNEYIFAEFGNPEAQALVQEKETKDRNRPLAIKMMVWGAFISVIGVVVFIFAWDKSIRKKR